MRRRRKSSPPQLRRRTTVRRRSSAVAAGQLSDLSDGLIRMHLDSPAAVQSAHQTMRVGSWGVAAREVLSKSALSGLFCLQVD
ncbi:hypothetical protein YC2023_015566 [Brassica napus]